MLVNGEFNTFQPDDAKSIVVKAHHALEAGGRLLLEPQGFDSVRGTGLPTSSWYSLKSGLFSPAPHVLLLEDVWDAPTSTATTRYFVIDAATGGVTMYAGSARAYTEDEYRSLLLECGFEGVEFFTSLSGNGGDRDETNFALVAVKKGIRETD